MSHMFGDSKPLDEDAKESQEAHTAPNPLIEARRIHAPSVIDDMNVELHQKQKKSPQSSNDVKRAIEEETVRKDAVFTAEIKRRREEKQLKDLPFDILKSLRDYGVLVLHLPFAKYSQEQLENHIATEEETRQDQADQQKLATKINDPINFYNYEDYNGISLFSVFLQREEWWALQGDIPRARFIPQGLIINILRSLLECGADPNLPFKINDLKKVEEEIDEWRNWTIDAIRSHQDPTRITNAPDRDRLLPRAILTHTELSKDRDCGYCKNAHLGTTPYYSRPSIFSILRYRITPGMMVNWENRYRDYLELFINYGVDFNLEDGQHFTPLLYAIYAQSHVAFSIKLVQLLIRGGQNQMLVR